MPVQPIPHASVVVQWRSSSTSCIHLQCHFSVRTAAASISSDCKRSCMHPKKSEWQ